MLKTVLAHFGLLVCVDAQRRAWFRSAQQDEACFAVLRVVAYRVGLIKFAAVFYSAKIKIKLVISAFVEIDAL